MPQVRISGSYNPKPGDYDGMHSFQSRSKDGFGGYMNTKVNKALKEFYKTYKLNPTISSINVIMDDTKWEVKWEVLIEESTDGKAYVGLTSRGAAGPTSYVDGPKGAVGQSNTKFNGLKGEFKDPKLEVKQILDFVFIAKIKGTKVRQIFGIYTNPSRYPSFPSSQKSEGIIVDSETNQPVNDVQFQIIENYNDDAGFGIPKSQADNQISLDLTSTTQTNPENLPKVLISSPEYESMEVIPYKGDGTIKTDLGVISLTPTNIALEQDKIKASQLTTDQIKEISKGEKGADYFSQERLSNQINTIKTTLIPSVLTLIAQFGVTKASDLVVQNQDKITNIVKNRALCPTQLELTSIIDKKNKLVKQLNNSLTIIDSTTKALGIAGGVIQALEIAYNVLKNLPIPTSTGVPGVPGLPTNVVLAIQDNKDRLDKLINKLKNVNASTLSILVLLRQVLLQAVQLLNLLDKLVEKCYPEADQEQVSAELTALTTQQSAQLSPVVTNVNGFEMGVETENSPNTLKRRRAVARNKQGVIMLKGDWSFSSIDQILIDELVFYIQQNNLKAE